MCKTQCLCLVFHTLQSYLCPLFIFVSEDGGIISSQILRQSSYYFVNKKSLGFVYFYSYTFVLNDWYIEKLDHFKPSVSCDMVILFQNSPVKLNSQLTLKCFQF